MAAFLIGLALLIGGYVVYGRFVASTVKPDPDRVTPAIAQADGVDYVAMPTWRVYLIQLLNIAGLVDVIQRPDIRFPGIVVYVSIIYVRIVSTAPELDREAIPERRGHQVHIGVLLVLPWRNRSVVKVLSEFVR